MSLTQINLFYTIIDHFRAYILIGYQTQCFTKLLAAPHCQGFARSAKQSIFVVYHFVPNEIKRTEK